jgi:hypothetical protein
MAENDIENQTEKHTEEQNLAMASNLMDDLEQRLKTHDWFYMMSDDNRKFNNGSAQQSEIRKLVKGLEAIGYGEDVKKLYNTYAPYTPGGSDLRMKEGNNESSALFNDLEQKLKSHDWFYIISDDNRTYTKGSAQQSEIRKIIKDLESMGKGQEAKDLYNKYAPYTPGGSDLRMKEAEEETHKMGEEEKHEDSSISELDMLDLYERFLNKK